MNRIHSIATLVAALAFASIFASPAQAQATRTWVSGVGDDANPCSRTAPCKTFAGAISKTAAGGEIDALDSGGFGTVTITKSITIDGGGNIAGILASSTNGVVVSAGATDVVILRNLSINGAPPTSPGINGVRFLSAGSLHLENVQLFGFDTAGVNILAQAPSTSPQVFLKNVSSLGNGTGVWVQPNGVVARVSVFDSKISDNDYGLRADNNTIVTIKNSQFTGNENSGIQSSPSSSSSTISVDGSLISLNFNGLISQGPGASTIYLSNNTITSNVNRSWGITNGNVISFGNNLVSGNGVNTAPTSTISPQ
jgi:hypothetical protein